MAQGTKRAKEDHMPRPEKSMELKNRSGQRLNNASWDPFSLMNSLREEMDRFFEDLGIGGDIERSSTGGFSGQMSNWRPTTEVFQRGGELVVRADLPGMTRDDVEVDLDDKQITIRGERKSEHEENTEGFFRSERSYGKFVRSIPVPDGVDAEQATANFKNGVLEITMPMPEDRSQRRRLEIEQGM